MSYESHIKMVELTLIKVVIFYVSVHQDTCQTYACFKR